MRDGEEHRQVIAIVARCAGGSRTTRPTPPCADRPSSSVRSVARSAERKRLPRPIVAISPSIDSSDSGFPGLARFHRRLGWAYVSCPDRGKTGPKGTPTDRGVERVVEGGGASRQRLRGPGATCRRISSMEKFRGDVKRKQRMPRAFAVDWQSLTHSLPMPPAAPGHPLARTTGSAATARPPESGTTTARR